MLNILFINLYIFLLALVFAILEIQIEGPHGWATNLPTWKSKKQLFGKNLTGYHLLIFFLALLIFHFPYVFNYQLTMNHELQTLSLFFMFVVLWDFLWFVLNPHYPLNKFKKEHIWWHKNWFLFAPVDYFLGLALSLLVLLVPTLFTLHFALLTSITWWFINIALFCTFTFFLIFFAQFILKIDKWKS